MTANHAHTPTTQEVKGNYADYQYLIYTNNYKHPPSMTERYAQFDRWLATVEAAAEQRGAVMVMDALKREANDPSWEGIVQPGRSLQELVDHIEHGIRADQMEGDDD